MKNNTKNIRKGITATLFAAVMIASVLAVVPVVSATVTVYADDRPGWESALCCGYAEEFFTDATLNPGVSVVTTYPGYVDTTKGVWWDRLVCPAGASTTTWHFGEPLTPLYGFGGNWNPGVPGGPGAAIEVAINGGWVTVGEIPNNYVNKFWGFVSTVPFSAVRLSSGSSSGWCETYELDNMVYAWDTTPPVITCPADVRVEQETAAGTVVPLTATATDICDADPTITSDELAIYPLGSTVVTFRATDDSGNSASCTTTVTVEDTTPPDISVTVSPDTLWPPNHKMVDITATVIVSDICDAAPIVVLTSITSDEPDNAIGIGDGNTVNDIQGADETGTDDYEFQLRAERAGTGDGRVYTITYTVTDASGNSASAFATVVVPHDMD